MSTLTTLVPSSKENVAVAIPIPPAPREIRATLSFNRTIFNCFIIRPAKTEIY